jgi:uncharacterized protein (DUF849 family)
MPHNPLIINLAPTGAVADAAKNPAVPVDNAAIAAVVGECIDAGATICHLHVRDDMAAPSSDPDRFADLIGRIRARKDGAGVILCASTSGRHGQSPEGRAAVLSLPPAVRPDMASLTLGSLNFPSAASVNAPDTIRFLADRMRECAVKPELEIFDIGMIEFARTLIAEGRISPPFYFNLLLGNVGSLACSVQHLGFALSQLPQPAIVSIGGIGRDQAAANALGVIAADGVRVGLEDNLWAAWSPRLPATNLQGVERVARLAAEVGRSVASVAYTRATLGLA